MKKIKSEKRNLINETNRNTFSYKNFTGIKMSTKLESDQ